MGRFGIRAPYQGQYGFACAGVAFVLLSLAITMPTFAQAQVVTDGSTPTGVVINANGSVTIGIAPSSPDGISLNRYDQFNVPVPGVELDNRAVAARTIVNEVTGTSQSKIDGPVEVLGQRAHVIVANPNGIVVDGGRFVNTGRVALTTGAISTSQLQIAPGIFQENVVSNVSGGTITIKGDGLAGQMDAVDLIAHSIRVNGPIVNDSANTNASIGLFAGQTRAEFDSSVLPGNTALNWSNVTGSGAVSDGAVLVEITSQGALRANRVQIEVSDLGAGVRFAGDGLATARGFTLSADGHVDLSTANIKTRTDPEDAAGANEFRGIAITGGSLTLDRTDISSEGAILSLAATNENGPGIIGEYFALSGRDIILTSDTDLRFAESILTAEDGSIQLDTRRHFAISGTAAEAFAHLLISADKATLEPGKEPTSLSAVNGSLILTTRGERSNGDLINTGSLIQGAVKVDGVQDGAGTESDGAVTLNIAGDLVNRTQSDNLAIIFGVGGDVSIRTEADVHNARGRVLSNGDIRIFAEGDILNLVDASAKATNPDIVEYTHVGRRQWWTLWIKRKQTSFVSYDYGTLERPDQLATITATGSISLDTHGTVRNKGGTINANGGDLEIRALKVETIGLGSGKVFVQRVCVIACSYVGDGTVSHIGGQLNAAGNVRIEAEDAFVNTAGSVFAVESVEITTEEATIEAALVPTVVRRPKGLYNFWASRAALLYLRDVFGTIIADTGNITVNSTRPVRVVGGSLTAAGAIDLENGEEIVRAPGGHPGAFGSSIGLLRNIP